MDHPHITNDSKVERFIVGDKAFILQREALVYEGFEIAIAGRPVYEIFEQVTIILGIPTLE